MDRIKVYSNRDCPDCTILKNFLREKNIPYIDIDVAYDEEAAYELIMKSGQMSVPVTEIDGRVIVGFNKEALVKALEI